MRKLRTAFLAPLLLLAVLAESVLPRMKGSREQRGAGAPAATAFDALVAGSIGILVVTIIIAVVVIPVINGINKTGFDASTISILNTVPVLLAVVIIVAVASIILQLFRV